MEDKIRSILIDKLRIWLSGKHIDGLEEDILNVVVFHPFEMDWNDLNEISGRDVSFTCFVKGKIQGVVKAKKTISFNFSGVSAVIESNKLVDLNIDSLKVPFFNLIG